MNRLVKLHPDFVMHHWDQLKECIAAGLPPQIVENPQGLLIIQRQLLLGVLECWAGYSDGKVYCVLTTQVYRDEVTEQNYLLIFSLTVVDEYPRDSWSTGLATLQEYARDRGCNKIVAYSNNPEMLTIADKLGFDITWRVIVLGV